MHRLVWHGHGQIAYPVEPQLPVSHVLEWRTSFDQTEYRLARYKGRVLLHLVIAHPVPEYYRTLGGADRKIASGGS